MPLNIKPLRPDVPIGFWGLRDRTLAFQFGMHSIVAESVGGFKGAEDAQDHGWIHIYWEHGHVTAVLKSKRQMRQLINAIHDINQGDFEIVANSLPGRPRPMPVKSIELKSDESNTPASQYTGVEELEMAEEKIRQEIVSEGNDISEKDGNGVSDFTDVGSEHYANYSASHVRPKRKVKTFGGVKSPNRARLSRKLDEALETSEEEIAVVKNGIDSVIASKLAAIGFEFTVAESRAYGTDGQHVVVLEDGQWKTHGEVTKEIRQIVEYNVSS